VLCFAHFYLGGNEALLAPLAARVAQVFAEPVSVQRAGFDPERAYDRGRGQYDARTLLAALGSERPQPDVVLGITGADLYIPALSYVFGQAELGGRLAVISLHRLRPELYGLPADDALLLSRTIKEAVHELGHTRGLLHCPRDRCAMRSSTYAETIDFKKDRLCDDCAARARRA
jgi:archaemetzincin